MKKQMLLKVVIAAQLSEVTASCNSIRGARPCRPRRNRMTQLQQFKLDDRINAAKSHTAPLREVTGYTSNINDEENSIGETSNIIRPANWRTLVSEDFNRGLGVFQRGSVDANHYKQTEDRKGVVRIQRGEGMSPILKSNTIGLDQSVSMIRVIFSFKGLGIEDADRFCLDHSLDDGVSWSEEKCWSSCEDFRNNIWYDAEIVEFTARDSDKLQIRFRCNEGATTDDILIDNVEIQAS
ncbi:hypothetical protein HJC23_009246 [Cyclotella cryptica]|uniref:MAM domain-containing protein n=1 Tax=Cyclotella cryptica TaxID=29204 RepID=A0ABD3Q508_9STRA|eukprot:CCRYP_008501-RA/>CCRYP_008501-RA protein AED:0.46 eAED:0.46 QI:0/-1/0/1/-1/1/1/0/237